MQTILIQQHLSLRIEKLRGLQRNMMQHTGTLSTGEIESFLQEIRQLYETALQLHHQNALDQIDELQAAAARLFNQPNPSLASTLKDPVLPVVTPVQPTHASIESEVAKPAVAAKPEPPQAVKEENRKTEPAPAKGEIHERFAGSRTIASNFSSPETIGKKISIDSPTVSDKLRGSIRDLKDAIGINEKFQFINYLFSGDVSTYNSVIEKLNSSTDLQSAKTYIQEEIAIKYQWDKHSASAFVFMNLVERRFT